MSLMFGLALASIQTDQSGHTKEERPSTKPSQPSKPKGRKVSTLEGAKDIVQLVGKSSPSSKGPQYVLPPRSHSDPQDETKYKSRKKIKVSDDDDYREHFGSSEDSSQLPQTTSEVSKKPPNSSGYDSPIPTRSKDLVGLVTPDTEPRATALHVTPRKQPKLSPSKSEDDDEYANTSDKLDEENDVIVLPATRTKHKGTLERQQTPAHLHKNIPRQSLFTPPKGLGDQAVTSSWQFVTPTKPYSKGDTLSGLTEGKIRKSKAKQKAERKAKNIND
jgi:hypothetical protein